MTQNYPSLVAALGSVTGATGVAVGIAGAASARTGAGTYTLTLDQACDSTQCVCQATRRGAAPAAAVDLSIAHTSDAVKTLVASVAGAAADNDFDFIIYKLPLS